MSKYKNKYAFYKGEFDSKEANRLTKFVRAAKQISNLKCQVAYQLKVIKLSLVSIYVILNMKKKEKRLLKILNDFYKKITIV